MLIGVVYGALAGNLQAVTEQAVASAKEAVNLCITMAGVMAFWVGMMNIADQAGVMSRAEKAFNPFISFLFPKLSKEHSARKPIAANIVANILGLGWACTPAGLKAMEELSKLSKNKEVATNEMCNFLILNISSLQLIPVNIIVYRSRYGSVNPSAIIFPAIVATSVSTLAGILFILIAQKTRADHVKY